MPTAKSKLSPEGESLLKLATKANKALKASKLAAYDEWYAEQVQQGLDAIKAGDVMDDHVVNEHMKSYIAKKTKNARKAA